MPSHAWPLFLNLGVPYPYSNSKEPPNENLWWLLWVTNYVSPYNYFFPQICQEIEKRKIPSRKTLRKMEQEGRRGWETLASNISTSWRDWANLALRPQQSAAKRLEPRSCASTTNSQSESVFDSVRFTVRWLPACPSRYEILFFTWRRVWVWSGLWLEHLPYCNLPSLLTAHTRISFFSFAESAFVFFRLCLRSRTRGRPGRGLLLVWVMSSDVDQT